MATGQFNYKYSNEFVDIETICEPYVYSYPQNPGLKYFYSDADSADPQSLETRFQKAATNTWAQSVRPAFTDASGSFPNIAKKGTFPTPTVFATYTGPNVVNFSYSSSGITIGSATYGPSSFRGGAVPTYIGVILVGGGGGGGGTGMDKGNKSGYNVDPGGSGGGGGVASFIINIAAAQSEVVRQLCVGNGGSGGSNGSTSDRPSAGTTGNRGGTSYIYISTRGHAVEATGGYGGVRGLEGASDTGNGGSGGSYATLNDFDTYCYDFTGVNGSAGNNCRSQTSTAVSLSRVFSNVGQSATTFYNNPATNRNYDSGDSYRNSYANGGSSYGVGGHKSPTATDVSPGYGGGGGASGKASQDGGGGIAIFYY